MNRLFLLTKILLKGNGVADVFGDSEKARKPLRRVMMLILLAFVGVYFSAIGVMFMKAGYDLFSPLGLENLVLTIMLSVTSFLVFFLGLFYVMSVFYFSNDVNILLPLPIRPGDIISAKFLATLFFEYIVILIFLLPSLVTFAILSHAGFLFYLYGLLVLMFLPVVPLVFASIIVMLIMRFAPAARNKDRFTLIGGMLALFVGLGLNYGIQAIAIKGSNGDISGMLSGSAQGFAKISSLIFPSTYLSNYAMSKPEGLDSLGMLLLFIIVSVAAFALMYLIGSVLYFKGVIGISDSPAKGKKLSDVELAESTVIRNSMKTYMLKEIRILFRTPIFFLNNVMVVFLMPILMIVPFAFGGMEEDGMSLEALKALISNVFASGDTKILGYILLAVYGFVTFMCSTNGITETAISRDGNCAYFMKIIPMSYSKQIWSKILAGVTISTAGSLFTIVILIALTNPPAWLIALVLLVLPGAILFPNVSGMIFDIYMPKIVWDNEQKAVKQNMNVLYGMLAALLPVGLCVFVIVKFSLAFPYALALITLLPLALTAASAIILKNIAKKAISQIRA